MKHLARLLLFLVAVGIYLPTLRADFVWDDHDLVETDPAVQAPGLVQRLPDLLRHGFGSSPFSAAPGPYYRPLTTLTLATDLHLGGGRPWAFHLTNVLLNALVVLLVHELLKRSGIGARWAFLGALLFAAHPVHAEPVAWVAGRADLLATLFFLTAYVAYRSLATANAGASFGRRAGPAGPWLVAMLVLVAFALAILAKEVALVLPLLLAGELGLARRRPRPAIAAVAAVWLVALAYVPLRTAALAGLAPGAAATESLAARLLHAPLVIGRALAILVAPWQLAPLYPPLRPDGPVVAALAIALLAVVVAIARPAARRTLGPLGRPAGLFGLALLPVLGIVPLVIPFGERFLYLPSAAFVWALATLGEQVPRSGRTLAMVAAGLLACVYTVRTVTYLPTWRDDVALFSRLLADHPRSAPALNQLGVAYASRGEPARARDALVRAVRLAPGFAPAHFNLSHVLETLGETDAAVRELRTTLDLQPDATGVATRLAQLLTMQGKPDDAVADLERAARRGSREAADLLRRRAAGMAGSPAPADSVDSGQNPPIPH